MGRQDRRDGQRKAEERLWLLARRRADEPTWYDNIRRLMGGRPIVEEPPERRALDMLAHDLDVRLAASPDERLEDLAVSMAIEGTGRRRVVTLAATGRMVARAARKRD